jgi:invasion protein IalB
MCCATKFSARKFTIARFVVFGLLTFSTAAVTQTLQPKQPQPALAAAPTAPTQPAPGEAGPPQPTWMVNCTNVSGGFDCRASQTLIAKKTGGRVLTLVVRTTPDAKKPVMLIQVPLGIFLPAGITLQIGKEAAKKLPLQSCSQEGCLTEYAVTDAEIAVMQQDADLTVSVQDLKKAPVTLQVPGLGFAAAYSKMK